MMTHLKNTFRLKTTSKILTKLFAASLLSASSGAVFASEPDEMAGMEPMQKQSRENAVNEDINLFAQENRLSADEVASAIRFQEEFSNYARRMLKRYPNQISRIWLEPAPNKVANIQFVGDIPRVVAQENIYFHGGGIYTMAEHQQRAELVAKVLKQSGYRNFMTHFDHASGQIQVEMVVDNASKAPQLNQVLETLSQHAATDSDLTRALSQLSAADIELTINTREGEIYDLDHSRGGNWLRDDGFRECTSGWSVNGPQGDGIITAAHCTGLNQFEESPSIIYSMTWRDQERGNGDAEYHTTTHIELPEFWATSSSLRDVKSFKLTFLMFPGNAVCVYGRSSNIRSCAHNVIATGVTATFTDGVTVNNLVRVSGDTSIGGDSGGGWSFGTTAWGVHSGSNGSTSLFTPIQLALSELNVTLKIAP